MGYGRVLRRAAAWSLSRAFAAWLACLILSLKERLRFCSIKVGSKPSSSASDVFTVDDGCPVLPLVFIVPFCCRFSKGGCHPAKRGWPGATRRFFGCLPQVTLGVPNPATAWPWQCPPNWISSWSCATADA